MSSHDVEADWSHINQAESRKRVQNRLSQRRHRAKVRQQAQEPSIPSEAFDIDGQFLSDEYLNLPLEVATLDGPPNASTHLPAQHEWETGNGVSAIQVTPSHQPNMYGAMQHSQSRWSVPSQPMSSQTLMTTEYPTPTPFQAGDTSSMVMPSTTSRPRDPLTESWNRGASSEPQWTNTRVSRPSKSSVSAYPGVEDSLPVLESVSRPTSTYGYQRRPSPRQEHQCTMLQQHAENSEDSPSPVLEHSQLSNTNGKRPRGICHSTGPQLLTGPNEVDPGQPLPYLSPAPRQRRHGSSSPTTNFDAFAPSPLPRLHTQHSHCRCATSDPSGNYLTQSTTPSTTVSSPTGDIVHPTAHRRSSGHAQLSPDHRFKLGDLVQHNMPRRNEYRSSGQSNWRLKKSRKCSSTDSSLFEEPSLESGLERGRGIEKVVIVYLRDGEVVTQEPAMI